MFSPPVISDIICFDDFSALFKASFTVLIRLFSKSLDEIFSKSSSSIFIDFILEVPCIVTYILPSFDSDKVSNLSIFFFKLFICFIKLPACFILSNITYPSFSSSIFAPIAKADLTILLSSILVPSALFFFSSSGSSRTNFILSP